MKLENKERVLYAIDELEAFNKNIEIIEKMIDAAYKGESGVRLHQYSDNSGLCTSDNYLDGKYNLELNIQILESSLVIFKQYRDDLLEEIETL